MVLELQTRNIKIKVNLNGEMINGNYIVKA